MPRPLSMGDWALTNLIKGGFRGPIYPVNPGYDEIEGLPVVASLASIESESVDTVTVYLKPEHAFPLAADLARLKPRRVIFNPGTEHPALKQQLEEKGVEVVENCTLVLLRTGQF